MAIWHTFCWNCWTIQHVLPGAGFAQCKECCRDNPVAIPRCLPAPSRTLNFVLPPRSPKRAVIVGISYKSTPYELKGSINDAKYMRYLLNNGFGFPDSSIMMLTEEETNPYKIPIKKNIRLALRWLVQDCRLGDSLVFHFSGHGGNLKDKNGDEVDGFDETILPLDFVTKGVIVDDEINATIVRPLPKGVKLHAIIDACFSGTVLDLPFICRMDSIEKFAWVDHRPPSGAWKGTKGGEAISFSACDDNQDSADSKAFSGGVSTGALTYSFIEAIHNGHGATYGSIMNYLKSKVNNTISNWRQDPQLTSNATFNVYMKPFSL